MSNPGYIAASFTPTAPRPQPLFIPSLLIAAGFGILTGIVEGFGLLIFQRINWARWGPTLHVSQEILWISPLVDLCLFLLVGVVVWMAARLLPRLPALKVLVFLFTFLALYDWLSVTDRLYQRACIILSLGIAAVFIRWLGRREDTAVKFGKATLPWIVASGLVLGAVIQVSSWLREENAFADLPPAPPAAPNVLVIVVDTLRADRIAAYGCPHPTSPNLDRIAREGVLFENAIAASSWTLPSHASLLTGRAVWEHGVGTVHPLPVLGWQEPALGGYPTLAGALEREGYRTGAFSANRSWFVRDWGLSRGFMHFEDYFQSPADMFARTFYGHELIRNYIKRIKHGEAQELLRYGHGFGIRKRADVINDELLRWIDRDHRKPFFAFLNYLDVHDPYHTPAGYPDPPWEQRTEVDRYDAGVRYVDDYIGRLLLALDQRHLGNNTLLIITSDHGEGLGQHGMEGHGRTLYWELVHVPLLIRFPGHVPAGQRVTVPVSNSAIAATLINLLGSQPKTPFPGPPLSALWKDRQAETHWPEPVSELVQDKYLVQGDDPSGSQLPTARSGWMSSLVTQRWHLIVHQKAGEQLYDWTADPGERNDLIRTPEGQQAARELSSRLAGLTHPPAGAPRSTPRH